MKQPQPRVTDTQPKSHAHSLTTRQKISLSKTKFTKDYLIDRSTEYIESITLADPQAKVIPSIVGLCLHIGISRSRLYELSHTFQEVADILEYVSMLQEKTAIDGGITQRLNPIFSMFLLKSKHGYQDSPQSLTQINTNLNISPDLLADALKIMGKSEK